MKRSFALLFLLSTNIALHAQMPALPTYESIYGLIRFDAKVENMENQWVVFPKNIKTNKFPFGYVYLDPIAGYTFELENSFQLDGQGRAVPDSVPRIKTSFTKVRLGPNTLPVYPVPAKMLADLKVQDPPNWLEIYQRGFDRNSVGGKVTIGKHLNSLGATQKALTYLEPAYKTDPSAAGLVFEITYSYNDLKRFDDAIKILKTAIVADPQNMLLYRELGFSYNGLNDFDNAIAAYKKGLEIERGSAETKAEIAWNMAVIYRDKKKDMDNYKLWGQKAKDLAPANSTIGRGLHNIVF